MVAQVILHQKESASSGFDDTAELLSDLKNMNPSFKEIVKESFIASAEELKLGGVHIDGKCLQI